MPQWARRAREGLGVEPGGAEIVAGLAFDGAVAFDLGFDAADHGEVGEHRLARITPIRGDPIDHVADGVAAGFEASAAVFIGFSVHVEGPVRRRRVEKCLDLGMEDRPVLFHRQ